MDSSMNLSAEQRRGFWTLLIVGGLEGILFARNRANIPDRDVVTCQVTFISLVLVLLAIKIVVPRLRAERTNSKRFKTLFGVLSALEVVFSIVIPWFLLFLHGDDAPLVPHLFVFQAQITCEAILMLGDCTILMFPYTCLANLYRLMPILTWWSTARASCDASRSILEEKRGIVPYELCYEMILPVVTSILWLYSTFMFIPLEWYPLLRVRMHDPEAERAGKV